MTRHTCPHCEDSFTSQVGLRDHAWEVHDACHRCGDRFDDRTTLYTHWLVVHGDDLSRTTRKRAEASVDEPGVRDRLRHRGLGAALRASSLGRRKLVGAAAVGVTGALGVVAVSDLLGGGPDGGRALDGHPAAAGLDSEPTLGRPPGEADATIIAFEDPSCPSCARFELETFPTLESELVEPGHVSFVYRGVPVVRAWAEPAVLALEATYARDPSAFWALKSFYYRSQARIDGGNLRRLTRTFLADRTDVDADAVVAAVADGTPRDAVDADLQASRDAGIRGTPTFFLFRDGSYLTEIVGAKSYSVFESALGL